MSDKELIKDLMGKVDNINDSMTDMKITLAKQEVSLTDHMRRTVINEKATAVNAQAIVEVHKELIDKLTPIQAEIAKVTTIVKFLGGLIAVGTLVIQVLEFLKN